MPSSEIQHALQLLQQGETANARGVLERLVGRIPVYVAAHVALAKVYELEVRWGDAYETWVRASELLPTNSIISEGLRRVSLKRGSELAHSEFVSSVPVSDSPGFESVVVEPPPKLVETEVFEIPEPQVQVQQEIEVEHKPEPEVVPDAISVEKRQVDARPSAVPEETSVDTSDLDSLIEQLDDAKIVPRDDFDEIPEPNLDSNVGDIASETLAKIFESQSQFSEAARIYEQLAVQQPDKASTFTARAEELRQQKKG